MERDTVKILQGGHFKSEHFCFSFDKAVQKSWPVMSAHELSCWLMSSPVQSWTITNTHECWWAPIASWLHAHDCSWALMDVHCKLIMNVYGCSWGAHEGSKLLMRHLDHSWAWGRGKRVMNIHESSREVMKMAPWANVIHQHSILCLSINLRLSSSVQLGK